MAKKSQKKPVKRKEAEAVETEPDAWERFEKTIGKIVPPKRHKPKSPQEGGTSGKGKRDC